MYSFSILILAFLNLYCYASPVPFVDQDQHQQEAFLTNTNRQQSDMLKPFISNTNDDLSTAEKLHQLYYLKMLCELYGHCDDNDDQQMIDFDDTKHKRLSSSLFHGIPKFGKRAFSSAFAGIPKFG